MTAPLRSRIRAAARSLLFSAGRGAIYVLVLFPLAWMALAAAARRAVRGRGGQGELISGGGPTSRIAAGRTVAAGEGTNCGGSRSTMYSDQCKGTPPFASRGGTPPVGRGS